MIDGSIVCGIAVFVVIVGVRYLVVSVFLVHCLKTHASIYLTCNACMNEPVLPCGLRAALSRHVLYSSASAKRKERRKVEEKTRKKTRKEGGTSRLRTSRRGQTETNPRRLRLVSVCPLRQVLILGVPPLF